MEERKAHTIVRRGLACVAALIVLVLVLRPPLAYYTNFTLGPRVLPARLIRPAIRFASDHDAPAVMEDAQGIFDGGRDPSVFVRFRTDDHGLEYVREEFRGPNAKVEMVEKEALCFGWFEFDLALRWQRELGIQVYDPNAIHSGRALTYHSPGGLDPSYTVLIDEPQHTVYILAWPHQ